MENKRISGVNGAWGFAKEHPFITFLIVDTIVCGVVNAINLVTNAAIIAKNNAQNEQNR